MQTVSGGTNHHGWFVAVGTLVTVYGYEGAPVHIGFPDEPIGGQTENPLKL